MGKRSILHLSLSCTMLDNIPIFTSVFGFMLLVLMWANRNSLHNNKRARLLLSVIVLLIVHTQLDAYAYTTAGVEHWYTGLSYVHFHLVGGLFLLFANLLFGLGLNVRKWVAGLTAVTLLRLVALAPTDLSYFDNSATEFTWQHYSVLMDAVLAYGLNIACLVLAYRKINNLRLAVALDAGQQQTYRWLKSLLAICVGIYGVVFASMAVGVVLYEHWLFYWKLETAVQGLFFFVLAYFAIRFPIFAVHGDFKALAPTARKYAKSSLTDDKAVGLWEQIEQEMTENQPWLEPDFRLNDLAQRMNASLHHVSQVINEKKGMSFSDYTNHFRIAEVQKLLLSERAKQLTVLAIALEVGFNSKTAFYNAFKKSTGKTPREWKKEQQA